MSMRGRRPSKARASVICCQPSEKVSPMSTDICTDFERSFVSQLPLGAKTQPKTEHDKGNKVRRFRVHLNMEMCMATLAYIPHHHCALRNDVSCLRIVMQTDIAGVLNGRTDLPLKRPFRASVGYLTFATPGEQCINC